MKRPDQHPLNGALLKEHHRGQQVPNAKGNHQTTNPSDLEVAAELMPDYCAPQMALGHWEAQANQNLPLALKHFKKAENLSLNDLFSASAAQIELHLKMGLADNAKCLFQRLEALAKLWPEPDLERAVNLLRVTFPQLGAPLEN